MSNYQNLISLILDNGQFKSSRAGNAEYIFGAHWTTDLRLGFPIITERKIDYKQGFGELAAFIKGCTKASEFTDLGCKYWNAYGEDLGPIYGAQWRNFNGVDQLDDLITGLRLDPYSRRHILTTCNPADLDKMVLPPCHLLTQFDVSTEGVLSCVVYMRSCDAILGLPYDIIVYAGLQSLLANQLNLAAGPLQFFFGNIHIYENHLDAAKTIVKQPARPRPMLHINNANLLEFMPDDFFITGYEPGPRLDVPLNL